jgi:hypothetical protein
MSPLPKTIALLTGLAMTLHGAAAQDKPPHNVILFVPDGLRALSVTGESAPTMAAIRDRGVNFKNSHSIFPTFTTANAASFATGHYPGDTGDFSNTIYVGYPVKAANGSVTPFLEANPVLGDVDQHFGGNYLDEDTILMAARHQGYGAAAIGKVGPTLIFDHTERSGEETIIVDDSTGSPAGIPLSQAVKDKLGAAGLPLATPPAATTARSATSRHPEPRAPTRFSKAISPMSPPRSCCRCSRRATSRSCSYSGRATPTAHSTIRATASMR